jgi:hypothetical protein
MGHTLGIAVDKPKKEFLQCHNLPLNDKKLGILEQMSKRFQIYLFFICVLTNVNGYNFFIMHTY